MTTSFGANPQEWSQESPIGAERVISGAPAESSIVAAQTPGGETGLWRCTPGTFTTQRTGCVEFVHIISGRGALVHEDGTVASIAAGVSLTLADGWRGHWVIEEPVVKAYATLYTATDR